MGELASRFRTDGRVLAGDEATEEQDTTPPPLREGAKDAVDDLRKAAQDAVDEATSGRQSRTTGSSPKDAPDQ